MSSRFLKVGGSYFMVASDHETTDLGLCCQVDNSDSQYDTSVNFIISTAVPSFAVDKQRWAVSRGATKEITCKNLCDAINASILKVRAVLSYDSTEISIYDDRSKHVSCSS
jgi:hypothetical protein